MPHRLTSVLALVGYEAKTVLQAECIGERGEFFDALCESLRLGVGHFDDICVVLFGDEQKMHGRLRIEVLDDDHIVVFVEFG